MPSEIHTRPGRRQNGFTLIECLIASIVLAFITTAVAYTLSAARQNARFVQEQRIQANLAQSLAATIAARPYTDPHLPPVNNSLATMHGFTDHVNSAAQTPGAGSDDPLFTRRVTVESLSDIAATGARAAVVSVHVTGPSNTTLVHRRIVPISR